MERLQGVRSDVLIGQDGVILKTSEECPKLPPVKRFFRLCQRCVVCTSIL
jgi:hypothetical protein